MDKPTGNKKMPELDQVEFLKDTSRWPKDIFIGDHYCCLKRREKPGEMPNEFGRLFENFPNVVYINYKNFEDVEIIERYGSIEEILNAGWEVD